MKVDHNKVSARKPLQRYIRTVIEQDEGMRNATLQDMIEFVLRQNGVPTTSEDILHRLLELRIIDKRSAVEPDNILFTAKAEPELFVVDADGGIRLAATQYENLRESFRKRIMELRSSMRAFPDSDTNLTIAVLIHALYVREAGASAELYTQGRYSENCLRQTIDRLAERFPGPMGKVVSGLYQTSPIVRPDIDHWLMFADLVKPAPEDAVLVMRQFSSAPQNGVEFVPVGVAWMMGQMLGINDARNLIDLNLDAGILPIALQPVQSLMDVAGYFTNEVAHMLVQFELDMLKREVRSSRSIAPLREPEDFDRVLAAPPWSRIRDPLSPFGGQEVDATTLIMEQVQGILSERGKVVMLVPAAFLFSTSKRTQGIREELVRNDLLEIVLQLPSGTFRRQTSAQAAIIVLNKAKSGEHKKHVLMVQLEADKEDLQSVADAMREGLDVTEHWKVIPDRSLIVRNDFLRIDRYNLLPARYVSKASALALQKEDVDGGMVALEDVVIAGDFERVPARMSERLNRSNDPPAFVRVSELAKDPSFPYLRLDATEEIRGDVRIIDRDAILVSRQFTKPYPTIYEAKGGRIAIASSVLAIRPDTSRILPEYLVHEMGQPHFLKQIKSISFGASIPSFTMEALMSTMIRLRPLERQREIVGEKRTLEDFLLRAEQARESLDFDGIQEFAQLIHLNIPTMGHRGMAKYLHEWQRYETILSRQKTKEEIGHNLKMLRHQFNNRLGWVNTGIGTLEGYLQNLMDKGIIDEDDRIAPDMEGDELPSPTLKEAIAQVLNNANELSELMERMGSSMERIEVKLEFIELWEFIQQEIAPHYRGRSRYHLKVHREAQGRLDVYADRFRLKHALMNILDNAVKHGLTEPARAYSLIIGVGQQEIIVGNDGVPPEITFEEMCIEERKAGKNEGSGHGIPIAVSLLQDFDASLEQIHPPTDRYDISLSFALRIYIQPAS